jgi:DNA-binding GntR family transcriptional regulator
MQSLGETAGISLAESAYAQIKASMFDFELLPGDRFSESEVADRLKMSRTPVRDALYRLEREGYLQVHVRVGWSVRPYDFSRFEDFYDLRRVLEEAAVVRLCEQSEQIEQSERPGLDALGEIWLVPELDRITDLKRIAALDESFHTALVSSAGNAEIARCHQEVTERIRIIRRLDFTQAHRIHKTYEEHGQILGAIIRRRPDEANRLLRSHIETSKAEVRKITIHRLFAARAKPDAAAS